MAHLAKYTKGACGNLWRHYERAKDSEGNYIKFSNQSIDPERTPLNYNLAPAHPEGQGGFVRRRCSEVKCLNRKDVNVMCSWVVTAPQTIPEKDLERFFMATYDFLINRYGQENVISAYVHMDEVTPHMHFAFVPVVESQNRKGEPILKVSAKELVTRTELKRFHLELEGCLSRIFGYEVGIINEATKNGNKSVLEMKKQDMLREGQKYKEMAEKCFIEGLKLQKQLDMANAAIAAKKAELLEIKAKIDVESQKFDVLTQSVENLKAEEQRLLDVVKDIEDLTNKRDRYKEIMQQHVGRMDKRVHLWLESWKEFDEFREGAAYEEAYNEEPTQGYGLSR